MEKFAFELDQKVTDKVTGFTGVVIARCDYLACESRYEVQPVSSDNSKMYDSKWLDEARLEEA